MEDLEQLRNLVAIPSETGNERDIAAYVASQCDSYGFQTTMVGDSIAAYMPGSNGHSAFVLSAHLDTVPVVEGWTTDPFRLTQHPYVPDIFYGLGSSDMKAGVVAALGLAKELARHRPAHDVHYLFSAREETDNQGAKDLAARLGPWARERYEKIGGIILEPTDNQFIAPGHRGGHIIKISAEGAGGHGSQSLPNTATAIEKLGRFIHVGLPQLRRQWAGEHTHPVLGAPSINPTDMHAGMGTHNIVPRSGQAIFDVRTTPSLEAAMPDILAAMKQEYDVIAVFPWEVLPTVSPEDASIYRAVKQALPTLPVRAHPGATDLPFYLLQGIPMMILGPGVLSAAHEPDEWVRLSSIAKTRRMVRTILHHF